MKIALISHLYPTKLHPHQGKFIQDQFDLLNEDLKIEVELIVPTPFSIFFTKRWYSNHSKLLCQNASGFRLNYLSLPQKRFPSIIQRSLSRRLSTFLSKKKYDLLHIHWLYPDGLSIPALKKKGFRIILTLHGSDWYKTKVESKLLKLLYSSLECSDKITVPSLQIKKDILDIYPQFEEKIVVLYNFVDSEVYKPVTKNKKIQCKKELGWDTSKLNALTVANMRPEKGLDLMIKSVSNNPSLRKINFHIVSSPENSTYSKKVMNLISKVNNIQISPLMKPSELVKYFQASDIYISPSRRESFGLAMTESAFVGVPIISTDTGIAPKLASMGYCKMLPNSDLSQLNSDFIQNALNFHNDDSEELIKAFSKKKIGEKLYNLYISTMLHN